MYYYDLSRENVIDWRYPLIDQIFRCLIMKKLLSFPGYMIVGEFSQIRWAI